jgi:8-oxo-dGTP pyrophosphatase MutT (NUDIX family)
MSTAPPRKTLKPRDAATLIIVDRSRGEPQVLMGRRRMDQVFMPGKFVFPGGSVDAEDRRLPSGDELRPSETAKLLLDMKGTPSVHRARALALAAVRETFEEAGLVIGTAVDGVGSASMVPDGWQPFLATGHQPKISSLTFFARAITPPGRPRRFDTRFFCVGVEDIAATLAPTTDELSGISWFTRAETRDLDLPPITHVVLEELIDRLKHGRLDDPDAPVPYYHSRAGTFRRDLLSPSRADQA